MFNSATVATKASEMRHATASAWAGSIADIHDARETYALSMNLRRWQAVMRVARRTGNGELYGLAEHGISDAQWLIAQDEQVENPFHAAVKAAVCGHSETA